MGTLSLTDPVNGTTADASLIADNNSAIKTVMNGGIDNTNINTGAAIAASKLAGYPSDGTKALFGDGTWGVPSMATAPPYVQVQNQQASGSQGGSAAATTWTTCVLNTKVVDSGSIATLASNEVTLPAGTYKVAGYQTMASIGGGCQVRLRNITDSATLLVGSTNDTVTDQGQEISLEGWFTLAGTKALAIQYWSSNAVPTIGLGGSASSGEVELYCSLTFEKWS